jgi:MtN3 and saliva related transmembrane protein
MTEIIGWVSSFILVLTIGKQVYKQWQDETSEGVSKWLFIGQLAASLGFTIYSWLVHNWVFVVTNALMLVNGLLGLCIVFYHRRRKKKKGLQGAGGKGSAKGKLEAERA